MMTPEPRAEPSLVYHSGSPNWKAIQAVVAERDRLRQENEALRRGYEALDKNWATLHDGGMDAIRNSLHMPDASVPEMIQAVEALRQRVEKPKRCLDAYCLCPDCRRRP